MRPRAASTRRSWSRVASARRYARSPAARRSRSTSICASTGGCPSRSSSPVTTWSPRRPPTRPSTPVPQPSRSPSKPTPPTPSCASRSATTAPAAPISPAAPGWSASRTGWRRSVAESFSTARTGQGRRCAWRFRSPPRTAARAPPSPRPDFTVRSRRWTPAVTIRAAQTDRTLPLGVSVIREPRRVHTVAAMTADVLPAGSARERSHEWPPSSWNSGLSTGTTR